MQILFGELLPQLIPLLFILFLDIIKLFALLRCSSADLINAVIEFQILSLESVQSVPCLDDLLLQPISFILACLLHFWQLSLLVAADGLDFSLKLDFLDLQLRYLLLFRQDLVSEQLRLSF